ncbi:hypothetical protein DFQ26_004860, partial [Actinomortierella ambigua]
MTRCLNLITIAAIATTTFLSAFAHIINTTITATNGTTYRFEIEDFYCQEIPGGISLESRPTLEIASSMRHPVARELSGALKAAKLAKIVLQPVDQTKGTFWTLFLV